MKTAIALCTCVAGTLLAGASHAHMYGRAIPLDTSYGLSVYKYEWHADRPFTSAVVQSAATNLGSWNRYPAPTIFLDPVEGWIGPVASGRWYRTKFYSPFSIFPEIVAPVYVAPDICGGAPPRDDK